MLYSIILIALPSFAKMADVSSLHTSQSFQSPPVEKKKKKTKHFKKTKKIKKAFKSKRQSKEQQDFYTVMITVAIIFLYLVGILLTVLGLYFSIVGLWLAGIILLGVLNLISVIFGAISIRKLSIIPQFIALSGVHLLGGIPILAWGIMIGSTFTIGIGIGLLVFFLIFLIFLILHAIYLGMLS